VLCPGPFSWQLARAELEIVRRPAAGAGSIHALPAPAAGRQKTLQSRNQT
jgi:hypothetical protein